MAISPHRVRRCSRAARPAASGSPWSAPGRRGSLARTAAPCSATRSRCSRRGPRPAALNEYGLATYKTTGGFAQKEIEWLLSIGGIEVRYDHALGEQVLLADLTEAYDAVFLGTGLAGVNALGLADEAQDGVGNAVDFIAALRQANEGSAYADLPVGRRVIVLGGGMTAIDAAGAVEEARRRGGDHRLPAATSTACRPRPTSESGRRRTA